MCFFSNYIVRCFYQMHYVLIGDRLTTSRRQVPIQCSVAISHRRVPTSHRWLSKSCKPIAISPVNRCRSIADKLQNLSQNDWRLYPYSKYGQNLVAQLSVIASQSQMKSAAIGQIAVSLSVTVALQRQKKYEQHHEKTCSCRMWTTKTQISVVIHILDRMPRVAI